MGYDINNGYNNIIHNNDDYIDNNNDINNNNNIYRYKDRHDNNTTIDKSSVRARAPTCYYHSFLPPSGRNHWDFCVCLDMVLHGDPHLYLFKV